MVPERLLSQDFMFKYSFLEQALNNILEEMKLNLMP